MEDVAITRIMPNSLEAEQSVVGSMIMDKQAIITAGEMLVADDFYHNQYGVMFQTMVDMNNEGRPVDIVTLGLYLHSSPNGFLKAVAQGIGASRGIILQFPLYAGMSGMMTASGLVDMISMWFVEISTAHTFPLYTFLSAGLVNIFIPSGGGQWAIQGPIMMKAAEALGANIPQTIMAFAWGDGWTNQIQPFWALPLLGVAGLSARDIMGYCVIWTIVSGVIISGTFVILSFM